MHPTQTVSALGEFVHTIKGVKTGPSPKLCSCQRCSTWIWSITKQTLKTRTLALCYYW